MKNKDVSVTALGGNGKGLKNADTHGVARAVEFGSASPSLNMTMVFMLADRLGLPAATVLEACLNAVGHLTGADAEAVADP